MGKVKHHPDWTPRRIAQTRAPGCKGCPVECIGPKIKGAKLGDRVDVLFVIGSPHPNDTKALEQGSGKFLRRCIGWANLTGVSAVTHALKCAPIKVELRKGKARAYSDDANPEAVEHCRQHLLAEVKRLRPRVIVTLGGTATTMVMGSSLPRGKLYRFNDFGVPVMPILNPAACVITGSSLDFQTIMSDLRRLRYWLKNGRFPVRKIPKTIFVLPPHVDPEEYREASKLPEPFNKEWPEHWHEYEVVEWDVAMRTIRDASVCVMDLETVGIDPYAPEADITSLAWSTSSDVGYVMPCWQKEFRDDARNKADWYHYIYEAVDTALAHCDHVVFHNRSFDDRTLRVMHQTVFGESWEPSKSFDDTLLMHAQLEPTSYHSMDAILASWGYESHKGWFWKHVDEVKAGHKALLDKAKEVGDQEAIDFAADMIEHGKANPYDIAHWSILARYNAVDTGLTFEMWVKFLKALNEKPWLKEVYFGRKVAEQDVATKIEMNGLAFDMEQNYRVEQDQIRLIREAGGRLLHNPAVLRLLIEEYGFPVDGSIGLDPDAMLEWFNVGSGKQVSRLLFGWHVKSIDGVKTEMVEDSLGCDTSKVDRKKEQYQTNKDVLARIVGSDWNTYRARHPWSRSVETTNDEGEVEVEHFLTGHELHKAYVEGLDMRMDRERMFKKLGPVAARTVADDIGHYRRAVKMLGTYVIGLREMIKPDGLVRDMLKVNGTLTGRWTSFLLTLPNEKPVKRMFTSRFGDDGFIMGADLGQIEGRVAASLANDRKMLAIFEPKDADFHRSMASLFYKIPPLQIDKKQRQLSKALTFSVLYGRIPEALAEALVTIGFSPSEALKTAEEFTEMFWSEFVAVGNWRDGMINDMDKHGVAVASKVLERLKRQTITMMKRRPLVGTIMTPSGFEVCIPESAGFGEKRRLATNLPTQATAAWLMKEKTIRICEELERQSAQTRVILEVHDAAYLDGPEDELDDVCRLVWDVMTDAEPHKPWLRTRLTTDIEVGPTLADLKVRPPEEFGRAVI